MSGARWKADPEREGGIVLRLPEAVCKLHPRSDSHGGGWWASVSFPAESRGIATGFDDRGEAKRWCRKKARAGGTSKGP